MQDTKPTKTSHTPGPWHKPANESVLYGDNGNPVVALTIPWLPLHPYVNVLKADADLIAAAPEMLDALRSLMALGLTHLAGYESAEIIQARAAIAKATGGAP